MLDVEITPDKVDKIKREVKRKI